ncbi:MAG: Ig-like domain-containing protein [Isosphaeraceae bacterium]
MDRRRFRPSGEGLEDRQLLSGTTPVEGLPQNFQQKELRIQNLPYFLGTIQPGRFLPPDLMTTIQNDLRAIAGTLHAPGTQVVENFNTTLRHALPYDTLSRDTSQLLNHAFTVVLAQAGTDPTRLQSLSASMNQLAQVDVKSINPSQLARNDYALVLQTALAVGRPIPAPAMPVLSPNDGQLVNNNTAGYTFNRTPQLVGSYVSGASTNGFTTIQIVDENARILGEGTVESNGRYSAKIQAPLPDGTYKLYARAIDDLGHTSKPSAPFTLKVATKS